MFLSQQTPYGVDFSAYHILKPYGLEQVKETNILWTKQLKYHSTNAFLDPPQSLSR